MDKKPAAAKSHPEEDRSTKPTTVAEIERQYPDEWVLVEIVRDHKRHERVVGRLIAHSPDRAALVKPHRRFRAEHPSTRLYTFFTGDLVADKDVVVIL
jgi:hypothetical protein